jgi:cytochrome c oxidase subunit II
MLDFMPERASNWAEKVDWINNLITDISIVCIVAITAAMLYFAVKYRKGKVQTGKKSPPITHNTTIEIIWTVIPTIICMVMFYLGYSTYRDMRTPPTNAIEINVDAYKWRWEFTYPNGRTSSRDLVVPLGKPVRLIMTSHDTLHSFFLPAMRVKEDIVPGTYSYLWFTPIKLGESHLFCTEYCGTGHSSMTGSVKVVTPEQYQDFLLKREALDGPKLPPSELGKELFKLKGCTACHSIDGSALVGPSLKGIFAQGKRKLKDGSEAVVDESYIKESLLNPQAKIAAGFDTAAMPSFQGQLSEEEIKSVIAYLKTL